MLAKRDTEGTTRATESTVPAPLTTPLCIVRIIHDQLGVVVMRKLDDTEIDMRVAMRDHVPLQASLIIGL